MSKTKLKKNVYDTHDNGGRAFRVIFTRYSVQILRVVYTGKEDDEDKDHFLPVVTYTNVQKVGIGSSPRTEMTEFGGGYGEEFRGAAILLELSDDTCIHVGACILLFTPSAPIQYYRAPVGNNDVPYPHAIDTEGSYYLFELTNMVKLTPTPQLVKYMSDPFHDPFIYYYDNLEMKDFENIERWYSDCYKSGTDVMSFDSTGHVKVPSCYRNMFVLRSGRKQKEPLSYNEYRDIIRRFGETKGFFDWSSLIIHDRATNISSLE